MQDRNKNRLSLTVMAVITGLILAAGGGVAWWTKSNLDTPRVERPNPSPIESKPKAPLPDAITEEKVVSVCWLNPTGDKIELVSNKIAFQKSTKPETVLRTALETLLAQPPADANYTTAIPPGTKLLSLEIKDTGTHINLSKKFVSGGGSAAMSSRLAQIIYTVSNSSDREPIWISVEGKPLRNLGEEGIIVTQPMTKEDFKDNFEGFEPDKSSS